MVLKAKISAAILLALFIGRMSDASLFPHTHFVDGHIISHAHPHSDRDGETGHEHSHSQLILIALMSVTVLAAAALIFEAVLIPRDAGLFVSLRESFLQRFESPHRNLRGPPASVHTA